MLTDRTAASTWRSELARWLQTNPKQIPDDLRRLRQQFVERFPPERLATMALEEYALGHDHSKDSFCYWLEWRTQGLGSVRGATVRKWGVWWDRASGQWMANRFLGDPETAIEKIRSGLAALVEAAGQGRFEELDRIGDQLGTNRGFLRTKPLSLYFPGQFLPIASGAHLEQFLRFFGLTPVAGMHARNRQLLEYLRQQPNLADLDTYQMMRFLYHLLEQGWLSPDFGNAALRTLTSPC